MPTLLVVETIITLGVYGERVAVDHMLSSQAFNETFNLQMFASQALNSMFGTMHHTGPRHPEEGDAATIKQQQEVLRCTCFKNVIERLPCGPNITR